jgi:hypothetical protein
MKYDYGDSVKVVDTAPMKYRPGQLGSIVGWREDSREVLGISPNDTSIVTAFRVEYGDGSDCEIPEVYLEAIEAK